MLEKASRMYICRPNGFPAAHYCQSNIMMLHIVSPIYIMLSRCCTLGVGKASKKCYLAMLCPDRRGTGLYMYTHRNYTEPGIPTYRYTRASKGDSTSSRPVSTGQGWTVW